MQVRHAREQYVRWLLATRDLSPHTIRAYNSDITALERHLGGRALVSQIDRDLLMAFIEAQRDSGLSPRSIRRRAAGLRGFCRWLQACCLLQSDPWAGTVLAVGRARKLPRLVPEHDLNRLVQSLQATALLDDRPPFEAVIGRPHAATTFLAVTLMIATGVRVNEVVAVRCDDIDLPSRTVRILGKGRRERQVYLTNDWITDFTRAYIEARASLKIEHANLLFNRHREPLTAPAMRARLAHAARTAGVGARITPHMLRHTAATQLIEAGVDIRYIQRLLGHANLSTTEIYTHVTNPALRRVVSNADVLGGLIGAR